MPPNRTSNGPRSITTAAAELGPNIQILRGAATAVGDMEAAVPSRVALSAASRLPNPHAVTGDRSFIYKGRCQSLAIPMALSAAAPGKGGGVLDRPVEKTTPGRQSEFDVKKSRKMSPPYRVILHNDNYNRREYVVKVLMKVIPGMTVDNAVNIMQEAHVNGLSVVIVCSQSEAEEHCTSLRGNGLRSSIEPASGGC
ncbi:hypothetical protein Zm00014a_040400 [Zea mays]|uniref:ATP-dependent Clp protease adapter protein CLPS1, chloroplastic n=4 Tax=Zea mays TaxID=4577 RepID=A0A8J8XKX0_MAIZE|nr:ATP-dependent Clp protease adapter protein CLPS1 chloroplastic [Zea mays]ONM04608.1 ATP-dependent Clp protease adapter protein CLPS1 chloroplastic [Zea mays]PWZ56260.1 ATP-dependent Clp protease adapter protein CLPS1, chloroplastic [Zea mays]PWZ56261.1 hypothetical protein Zm00014a_040400 [Zea mays]